MLPRFYDADGGAVLVDGNDVREYRLKSLRDQISLVDQQVRLFNASVAENIAYGLKPKPDEARIVEDRKNVVEGKSGSGRVDTGGRGKIKKKKGDNMRISQK